MIKNWKKQQNHDKKESLFRNLSRAFDPINHSFLLPKMKVYSLSDEALICLEFSRLPVFRVA